MGEKGIDREMMKTHLLRLQKNIDAKIKDLKDYTDELDTRLKFLEDDYDAQVEAEEQEDEPEDEPKQPNLLDPVKGGLFG